MKQLYAFILALFYLCFTNGVTIYQHYCMGELESVSIVKREDSVCSKCGMNQHRTKNNGCCKDVAVASKKSGDFHTYSSILVRFATSILLIPLKYSEDSFIVCHQNSVSSICVDHGPPLIKKQPLYITYDNFRI